MESNEFLSQLHDFVNPCYTPKIDELKARDYMQLRDDFELVKSYLKRLVKETGRTLAQVTKDLYWKDMTLFPKKYRSRLTSEFLGKKVTDKVIMLYQQGITIGEMMRVLSLGRSTIQNILLERNVLSRRRKFQKRHINILLIKKG